jgi:hypothetical protein
MFGRKSGQFRAVGKSERLAGLFVGSFPVHEFLYEANPYSGGKNSGRSSAGSSKIAGCTLRAKG